MSLLRPVQPTSDSHSETSDEDLATTDETDESSTSSTILDSSNDSPTAACRRLM